MATRVRSFSKINLGLAVGAPRADGFHGLVTVYGTLALHDLVTVTVRRGAGPQVSLMANHPGVPTTERGDPERNTAWRMVTAALERMGVRAEVTVEIDKRLPVQGGLGAGSANAAAALLGLERELGMALPGAERMRLAAEVGSDVPLFLLGGTVLGLGRGEEVYPLPDLPAMPCVVAVPAVGVSTAAAFRELDGRGQGRGSREQGTGSREQGTGSREQGTGLREQGSGLREQGSGLDSWVAGNEGEKQVPSLRYGMTNKGGLAGEGYGVEGGDWAAEKQIPSLRYGMTNERYRTRSRETKSRETKSSEAKSSEAKGSEIKGRETGSWEYVGAAGDVGEGEREIGGAREDSLTSSPAPNRLSELSRVLSAAWSFSGVEFGGQFAGQTGIARADVEAQRGDLAENPLLALVRTGIENDFEEVVFSQHPSLRSTKRELMGSDLGAGSPAAAVYAALSGSGSALFGLYKTQADARAAQQRVQAAGTRAILTETLTRTAYWNTMFDQ